MILTLSPVSEMPLIVILPFNKFIIQRNPQAAPPYTEKVHGIRLRQLKIYLWGFRCPVHEQNFR